MFDSIKKLWRDPVGSKVIAAGIIAAIATSAAALAHILNVPVPFWILLAALIVILLLAPYWWKATQTKKPELYLAWHGSAGWGIGGHSQMDGMERVLRLQGPVVISSSGLTEPIIITAAELEGAEYVGPHFQIFELRPSETIRQTLMLNFRGVLPEQGVALRVNLTLVDIQGNRYPLKANTLRAFPGPQLPPEKPRASPLDEGALVIDSPDRFSLRIYKVDSGGIRGIQLHVENHRLTSIYDVRVTLSSAASFDSRQGDLREASLTGQTFSGSDVIRPSFSGRPILLLWKTPQFASLVTGENNVLRQLVWPNTDKTDTERWKLSIGVHAADGPADAPGHATALRELTAQLVVLWHKTRNEFSIEAPTTSPSLPETSAAFPSDGKDGIKRTTIRYIMSGRDQLFAYTTTRDGLPGTRFLVVRTHPESDPQSVETPSRDDANARWNEWYQEWKRAGFGGASGNGLDGEAPF